MINKCYHIKRLTKNNKNNKKLLIRWKLLIKSKVNN